MLKIQLYHHCSLFTMKVYIYIYNNIISPQSVNNLELFIYCLVTKESSVSLEKVCLSSSKINDSLLGLICCCVKRT